MIQNTHPLSKVTSESAPAAAGTGYVLITGATGLVGQYLLQELYLAGQSKIAVVVRSSKRMNARQRIESILAKWEQDGELLPRPIVFEGDVSEADLGLNREQLDWINRHVDRIIHNAAILQFNGADRNSEPWRTNLGGTQNVIALAESAGIKDFHYVSTAYVCGKRDSKIHEDELDCGQQFRNDYEQSKFEAELAVRNAAHLTNKTIYRPAVIVGDSKTGFTSSYHGLFLYLRLLATLVPQQQTNADGTHVTPIRLPISGDEPRNLVPVDWVARVISRLFVEPKSHGKTFHLVPDKFTTARDVIDFCYEYFNSDGVEYCEKSDERPSDNDFATRYFENARIYQDYEKTDPLFDCQNLKQFAGDIACPEIDKDVIRKFMEYGQADAWGKRRSPLPEIDFDCYENLPTVLKVALKLASKTEMGGAFNVNVKGPGGGQWHVTNENGQPEIHEGLIDAISAIETTASKLKRLSVAYR